MPFEVCGGMWRVRVPASPNNYTSVDVYDHAYGSNPDSSLIAAKLIRDELASTMPFPLTAMLRQYSNGTFATSLRLAEQANGLAWTVSYLRLDETTLKARAAMVSRSITLYGDEGAKASAEQAWREKVLEEAAKVDRLVRKGVPILHHGPTAGTPSGRGSRSRVNSEKVANLVSRKARSSASSAESGRHK